MENTYPIGVVKDPRPIQEKVKDHLHVAGSVPILWKELDLNNLSITVSQRFQDGSLSCLFQAMMSLLEKLTGKVWSASIYFWRKNYPDGGSYIQDVGDVVKNKHTLFESLSPSQNQTEAQMNEIKELLTTMGIISYVQPSIQDIDQIAEAIEGYGGCIVSYETNNAEYDHVGQTPIYLGVQITDVQGNYVPGAFGHGICALAYGLINGIKTIVCRDSAGQWSAPNGIRFIQEDFHRHRNTGALYVTGVVDYSQTAISQPATIPDPTGTFPLMKPETKSWWAAFFSFFKRK